MPLHFYKIFSTMLAAIILILGNSALASDDVRVLEGPLDYIACMAGERLNLRDETLSKVLFTVKRHEPAKVVQSFGQDQQEKTIDGVKYVFIKVQFPERTEDPNIGWVAQVYIKTKSECGNYTEPAPSPVPLSEWTFPTVKRASQSYKTGARRFGASRSGGSRYHAAADLYRVHGEKVLSVNTGKVIRDRYYFYEGTYAIEVKHSDGKVARYGEINGQVAAGVGLNKVVASGQNIGFVGTVTSGCCNPMLHFELYQGTATGALTQGGNKFNRRSDLIDPTSLLTEWEHDKFGVSY